MFQIHLCSGLVVPMCFKKEFFGNHGKYPRKTLKCESGLSTFDDLNIVNLPETSSIT